LGPGETEPVVDYPFDYELEDQLEVEPAPSRHRVGRRLVLIGGIAVALIVVILGGLLIWIDGHLGGKGGAAVQVQVADQAGHGEISADLGRAHVIADAWLFHHYLDYRSIAPAKGGTYTFHLHEGYRAALSDLNQGPQITQIRLTIPEGYDLQQIAAKVGGLPGFSAPRFLSLAQSGAVRSAYEPTTATSLEGFLFPDTYFVTPGEDEQAILQAMVSRFDQVAGEVGLANSAQTNGLSPSQTLVLASLIENEAKIDADRGKIARVIVNRLAKGMKLQIDATVEYAEGVHKTRLLDSDLATPSPYNTYLHAGLPPGPIGGPGRASLLAALNPTPGTWLYYVLIDADGQHGFATTPAEFNQLKAEAHAKGLI
jgi:UPF0755 protein